VHVSNRNVDFSEEGYDLAIRVRAPADSTLIARHLEDAELVVVASPDYLAARGTPAVLDDLDRHECIQFDLPSSGRRIPWLFRDQGKDVEIAGDGGYVLSEDVLGGVTLARHGAGLFQTYRFIVEDDLRDGRLVAVLPAFGGRSRPFSLLYPHGRHLPLRVRSFIDFLVQQVA
jgi:DNA-binding transcriptional LysR family regulator